MLPGCFGALHEERVTPGVPSAMSTGCAGIPPEERRRCSTAISFCCFFANLLVQDRALLFFLFLLSVYIYIYIAGWALLVHQTVRFTIVGRLPWGHRCNTWRIGMPKLSRPPNVTFYNSWALWGHQTLRFTIVGRLPWGQACSTWRIGMPKLSRATKRYVFH